jgi:hypothetical protein
VEWARHCRAGIPHKRGYGYSPGFAVRLPATGTPKVRHRRHGVRSRMPPSVPPHISNATPPLRTNFSQIGPRTGTSSAPRDRVRRRGSARRPSLDRCSDPVTRKRPYITGPVPVNRLGRCRGAPHAVLVRHVIGSGWRRLHRHARSVRVYVDIVCGQFGIVVFLIGWHRPQCARLGGRCNHLMHVAEAGRVSIPRRMDGTSRDRCGHACVATVGAYTGSEP